MKHLFKNYLDTGALGRPTTSAFSILFTLEPLYRSIMVTVVRLMALERFGSAQDVSIFFFVLGILGVGMSLAVPWLVGYAGAGLVTIGIGASMGIPYLAVALILLAALFAVLCDSVGNTLFHRAVRSWERSEMATVFGSYRSSSSLAFPGIYAGMLTVFPLPAVFVFTGLGVLATSLMTRFIPAHHEMTTSQGHSN